jgi:hypothetical protein
MQQDLLARRHAEQRAFEVTLTLLDRVEPQALIHAVALAQQSNDSNKKKDEEEEEIENREE